ncbi:DedA family protein [Candidatus Parcubacteria bacterium]|uniref:Cytochrome B n=1 Tax=Candidatus Kaiserbacteria bacterium CG10_big_fil_rev_8_21_14_0_10_47_16 TaxID=1974608 RepID=A0A2H0UE36_9BACT|nr:DedA family protein [Candidatus Parcubacteria bacterium]PIR84647.1 MAG: cytochrome B [Candidatus Kaiserbacteria bacterium CG10_big_fil_rev_8_21_14_0_10_47_16]
MIDNTKQQTQDAPVSDKAPSIFHGRRGEWFLGLISFTESSFLPVIVDPFLLAATLGTPRLWFRYAMIAIVTSVLGGLFGYAIGAVFFDYFGARMIEIYSLENLFQKTVEAFDSNAFLFTLLGAVTPIPYKLVAVVGGFLKISLWQFVLASIIGRGVRFILVAYIVKNYGQRMMDRFNVRLRTIMISMVVLVVLYAGYTVFL